MNLHCQLPVLLFFIVATTSLLGRGTPDWVKNIRPAELPQFVLDEDPDAVILREGKETVISASGVFITTITGAILVRRVEGYSAARIAVPYSNDTDKVISFQAWTLPKKGKPIVYEKKDFVDSVSSDYKSIATSARVRSIYARGDMKDDTIFAYEAVVEDKGISSQEVWFFQTPYPILKSSISYEFGAGWDVEAKFFNMAPIPSVESSGKRSKILTWTATSIPGVERQPLSPAANELIRWAAFNILPSENSNRQLHHSWDEISLKHTPIYESLAVVTPAMEEKVNELTKESPDQLTTIKTLSEFAQSINYISVALDLGKGGGYKPRPANEVFDTKYGDCKDKTNLLQGLLKVKGIELYPLIVHSGQAKIFENWPSVSQFNHCVAAIKVAENTNLPATIEHHKLGKLLIFDPTSTFTPFGDIPYSIQDSKGIILAGVAGGLVNIPRLPLDKSLVKLEIELELMSNGKAFGVINENSSGQAGKRERQYAFTSDSDYTQMTKDWIASYHPGAEIGEPDRNDDMSTGNFSLRVEFGAPSFAKNMRNVLLIFKPVVINRVNNHPFGDEEREQAVDLFSYNLQETTTIHLPVGFEISELPEDVSLRETFASYDLKITLSENTMTVNRSIQVHPVRVPLEDYPTLEAFYKARIKADQSAVVLERL